MQNTTAVTRPKLIYYAQRFPQKLSAFYTHHAPHYAYIMLQLYHAGNNSDSFIREHMCTKNVYTINIKIAKFNLLLTITI